MFVAAARAAPFAARPLRVTVLWSGGLLAESIRGAVDSSGAGFPSAAQRVGGGSGTIAAVLTVVARVWCS